MIEEIIALHVIMRDLTTETRGISIKELRKLYPSRYPLNPWHLTQANVDASASDTETSPSATSKGADSTSNEATIVTMNKAVRNPLRIVSKLPFPAVAMTELPSPPSQMSPQTNFLSRGRGIDGSCVRWISPPWGTAAEEATMRP